MSERGRRRWTAPSGAALVLLVILFAAGCGDGTAAPEGGGASPTGGKQSYPEGEMVIAAEMLDTGLLKGNATVEAKGGWRAAAMSVAATDPGGANWGVIQFPKGVGSASASEFFEVQLGELSRGEQLAVTLTVTFESDRGERVERQATDHWPP